MPRHPIAIVAITSCTNTSDPGLLIAAGLIARKAHQRGLRVPAWVKTSLAPGSPAAPAYLERSGLLDDLSAVGFDIVAYTPAREPTPPLCWPSWPKREGLSAKVVAFWSPHDARVSVSQAPFSLAIVGDGDAWSVLKPGEPPPGQAG